MSIADLIINGDLNSGRRRKEDEFQSSSMADLIIGGAFNEPSQPSQPNIRSVENTVDTLNEVSNNIKNATKTAFSEKKKQPQQASEDEVNNNIMNATKTVFSKKEKQPQKTSEDAWNEYIGAKDNLKLYEKENGKKGEEYQRLQKEKKQAHDEYYKINKQEKEKESKEIFADGYNFGDVTKYLGNLAERKLYDPVNYIVEKGGLTKDEAKFLGESAASSLVGKLTGYANAPMQYGQEGAKQAKEKSAVQNLIESGIKNIDNTGLSSIPEFVQESAQIWQDPEKSTGAKSLNVLMNLLGNNPISRKLKAAGQFQGIFGDAESDIKEQRRILEKPSNELRNQVIKDAQNQSEAIQTLGNTTYAINNMLPDMALAAMGKNPGISEVISNISMAVGTKGQATKEAEERGADIGTANDIGYTKALTEVGTEHISGISNKFYGKGIGDSLGKKVINKFVPKNKFFNYVSKKLAGQGGEIFEELLSDVVGTAIDRSTVDPNAKYTLEDAKETVKTTFLTTLFMDQAYNTVNYVKTGKTSYQLNVEEMKEILQQAKVKDFIKEATNELITENMTPSQQQQVKEQVTAVVLGDIQDNIDNIIETNYIQQPQQTRLTQEEQTQMPIQTPLNEVNQGVLQQNNQTLGQQQTGLTQEEIENYVQEQMQQQEQPQQNTQLMEDNLNNNVLDYLEGQNRPQTQEIDQTPLETPTEQNMALNTPKDTISNDIRNDLKQGVLKDSEIKTEQNKVGNQLESQHKGLEDVSKQRIEDSVRTNKTQEKNTYLSAKEREEFRTLKDLDDRGLLEKTDNDYKRLQVLEKKAKGIVKKYADLKTNNKFEDIKSLYGKYRNSQISKENNKVLNEAKNIVEANKQGRRTIDEWKQIAEYIGTNANVKSSEELQKLAMETWFESKPNSKENLNRQGKKYVKFGVDDWVNAVYKGAGVGQEIKQQNVNEFNGYTDKEINNIESTKIKIANNEEDIVNYAKDIKNKKDTFNKMYLGKIKEKVANYIKNKFGINIDGYNISLNKNGIEHSINHHSSESELLRGQVPITEEDFKNIPTIINEADNITRGYDTKENKPSITFEKNINGNNVVVTYVSDKHHNLELKTMFKFKDNKKINSVTAVNENNSLTSTPKANSDTNLFDSNISQPKENVKLENTSASLKQKQNNIKYKEKLYHGTDEVFEKYDIEKFGKHDQGDFGQAVYFAKNKSTASKYGKNIKTANVELDNPYVINNENDYAKLWHKVAEKVDKTKLSKADLELYNDEYTSQKDKDFMLYDTLNAKEKRNIIKDMGYDGIVDNTYNQVAVFDTDKINKNTINESKQDEYVKMSAKDITKTLNDTKQGIPDGKQMRSWVDTSNAATYMEDSIKQANIDAITYEVQSNKKTYEQAVANTKGMSYEQKVFSAQNKLNTNKKVTPTDLVEAQLALREAATKGDTQTYLALQQDIAIMGTELGQLVQSLSMIQKLSPDGQLMMLQKIVNRQQKLGNKNWDGVEFDEKLVQKVLDSYDDASHTTFNKEKMDQAVDELKQNLADQMKVGVSEKINEWRYLSMLGNPKTHIRNIVANVAMTATKRVKETLNAGLQDLIIRNPQNKTATLKRATQEVKDLAKLAYEETFEVNKGNKYNEKNEIEDKRQIFNTKVLEGLRKLNAKALDLEDQAFKKLEFQRAFSNFLAAQKIKTAEDINTHPEIIQQAKAFALEESKIATFQQDNEFANWINKLDQKGPIAKVVRGAVIPFTRTPLNIAKTGLEYAPGTGLLTTIADVKKAPSNMKGNVAINGISKQITGTSLALLGYALAKKGILQSGEDDDKEGKFKKDQGLSMGFSIKIGDKYYDLSWLSPSSMPLFVGASMFEELEKNEGFDGNVVMEGIANTLDPLSEMSCISSFTQVIKSFQSGSGQMISSMAQKTGQNYLSQFVPTVSSQFARLFDDKKRSTNADRTSSFKFGQETLNQLMYKVPGLRNLLPEQTDYFGETKTEEENPIIRGLEAFLSPANSKKDISSDETKELLRVYEATGDTDIIPSSLYKYMKFNGETLNMSNDEWNAYKGDFGVTFKNNMAELMDNSDYINASEEEKAQMISGIMKYSKDKAKDLYLTNQGIDYSSTSDKVDDVTGYNYSIADYYIMKTQTPDLFKGNADSVKKTLNTISDLNISANDYYEIKNTISGFTADKNSKGKTISGSKKNKVVNYVNSLDYLTDEQKYGILSSMYKKW